MSEKFQPCVIIRIDLVLFVLVLWHLMPNPRYIYQPIGIIVREFANVPGNLGSIPGRVMSKTQKMVLDASLLNTPHYKVQIKGERSNLLKGVAHSSTPRQLALCQYTSLHRYFLAYVFLLLYQISHELTIFVYLCGLFVDVRSHFHLSDLIVCIDACGWPIFIPRFSEYVSY